MTADNGILAQLEARSLARARATSRRNAARVGEPSRFATTPLEQQQGPVDSIYSSGLRSSSIPQNQGVSTMV